MSLPSVPSSRHPLLLLVGVALILTLVAPATWAGPPQAQETAAAVDLAADPRVAEAAALLETWLDAEMAYDRIPGLTAGFVHDQQLVWSAALGVADRDSGRPATTDTLFSICSSSLSAPPRKNSITIISLLSSVSVCPIAVPR